jgi:hypothetical protein
MVASNEDGTYHIGAQRSVFFRFFIQFTIQLVDELLLRQSKVGTHRRFFQVQAAIKNRKSSVRYMVYQKQPFNAILPQLTDF